MRKQVRALLGFAVGVAAVGTACSDAGRSITAVDRSGPVAEKQQLLDGLLGGLTNLLIPPVKRNTPLANDVTWSFVAGPSGAVSSNSGVGLTIAIPYGALSTTQTITVTALTGSAVAYTFEPHGLQFAKNVILTQNLKGTSAGGLLSLPILSGAYFETDRLELNGDGLAVVTEIIPALSLSTLLTKSMSFPIKHFSGYIAASGRATEENGLF